MTMPGSLAGKICRRTRISTQATRLLMMTNKLRNALALNTAPSQNNVDVTTRTGVKLCHHNMNIMRTGFKTSP
jgi:hypothetical protein